MSPDLLRRRRLTGLWRHRDFMKLWVGQTVSAVGSMATGTAVSLIAALSLGATPLQMGLLAAISSAPILLFGLLAGAWVDRLRRRPLMIAADLGRALLLLSIPLAAVLGTLHLAQLFAVLPLVSVLSVLFDSAYQSFVPSLVSREQLLEANSKLGMSLGGAEVVAPGLGGLLVQTVGGSGAMLLDALSFLCSAALISRIGAAEPPPGRQERAGVARDIAEGLQAVSHNALLRALAGYTMTSSFFGNFFGALYTLYAVRTLGLGPLELGLTVGCGGAGSLIGALSAERITRRYGAGRTLLGAATVSSSVGLLIPLAGGPPPLAAAMLMTAQLIADATATIFNIDALSLRQVLTPHRLLGRVNATMGLLDSGIGPFGALAGGILGEAIGIRQTVAVAVIGGLAGVLWLVWSPIRHVHMLPLAEPGEWPA